MRVGFEELLATRSFLLSLGNPTHPKGETGEALEAIAWSAGKVRLLDQSRLPLEEAYLDIDDYRELARAIREMRIRGAPALGVAAAYGLALTASSDASFDLPGLRRKLVDAAALLRSTRPTAVNLSWALERMLAAVKSAPDADTAREVLLAEARSIHQETVAADRRIGELGADLLPDVATVLTHCNTGELATGGYGTALAIVRHAHEQGKKLHVFVDETRPLLQGARLTAWELKRLGIPATLIVDSAAGGQMRQGRLDCVLVGADRIAANGDVANKVGTYSLAVLARENAIPFYVAAPTSTIDPYLGSGDEIPIEERSPEEVTLIAGQRIAPVGVNVANPAFDIAPHRYISAIITEREVLREPYVQSIARLELGSREGSRVKDR